MRINNLKTCQSTSISLHSMLLRIRLPTWVSMNSPFVERLTIVVCGLTVYPFGVPKHTVAQRRRGRGSRRSRRSRRGRRGLVVEPFNVSLSYHEDVLAILRVELCSVHLVYVFLINDHIRFRVGCALKRISFRV